MNLEFLKVEIRTLSSQEESKEMKQSFISNKKQSKT